MLLTSLVASLVATLVVSLFASLAVAHASPQMKVIYGDDNRHELFEEKDAAIASLAESTVAIFDLVNLHSEGKRYRIKGKPLGEEYNLCKSEPYRDQVSGVRCSAFLVAPDLVVTAGHCLQTKKDCKEVAFAFGFSNRVPGKTTEFIQKSETYFCKELVAQEEHGADDYAVIRLDRKVTNHAPIELERSNSLAQNDPLFVVGHPCGIPAKIADGASVRTIRSEKSFLANLDTYGGNSGSAVFNMTTRRIEGILRDGAADYVKTPEGCWVSARCADDSCQGEDVTRIATVLPYLEK